MGKRPPVKKEFLNIKEMARRITLLSEDETNEDDVIGYGEDGSLKFVVLNKDDETTELRPAFNNTDSTYYVTNWLPLSTKQFKNIIGSEFPQRIALVNAVIEGKEIKLQPSPFRSYTKNDLRVRLEHAKEFEEENGITPKDKAQDSVSTDKVYAQDRREAWLKELINQQGLDALRPLGQLGVWNECAKLANDPHLLPIEKKRTDQIKGFYSKQSLIAFR